MGAGQELDDAIGPRSRGLSPAARADPVAGQSAAAARSGLSRWGRLRRGSRRVARVRRGPGAIPQEMFEATEIVRHVAVHERDADARVNGKTTVLPGEHVGGVEHLNSRQNPGIFLERSH